jgi:predicted small lipoprotein YifL
MPVRTLIIVLLAGSALAGCGRRGELEPPGAPSVTTSGPPVTDVSPLDPGSIPDVPAQQQLQPPPRRRLFLDFLL